MSARARLERCCGTPTDPALIADLDAYRAEVLAEAIKAAQSEMTTEGTSHPEDLAYDQGVSDAIAAISRLHEGGAR